MVRSCFASSCWYSFGRIAFKDISFDKSRWAIFNIAMLGFGIGALLFHYRRWLIWLWNQLLKIHTTQDVLLASLFLLGVIMGFFVVRNWSKDQKDFVTSLSAVVGGAFVSSIIGDFGKDSAGLSKLITFTYYFWGFTISGAVNLLAFTFLTARYTSNQSAICRAIIDFLYGSDKAKAIDAYFLRNFEDDLDYAKSALLSTLREYREIIRGQLAERFETQRKEEDLEEKRKEEKSEAKENEKNGQGKKKRYFVLLSIELQDQRATLGAAAQATAAQGAAAQGAAAQGTAAQGTAAQGAAAQGAAAQGAAAQGAAAEQFVVTFRELQREDKIESEMFRVAVSMRWQDTLEYVLAPGEYRKSFPYLGSVAGLALFEPSNNRYG